MRLQQRRPPAERHREHAAGALRVRDRDGPQNFPGWNPLPPEFITEKLPANLGMALAGSGVGPLQVMVVGKWTGPQWPEIGYYERRQHKLLHFRCPIYSIGSRAFWWFDAMYTIAILVSAGSVQPVDISEKIAECASVR